MLSARSLLMLLNPSENGGKKLADFQYTSRELVIWER